MTINQTPYNMSKNYLCVSIKNKYAIDQQKEQSIRKELFDLINNNKNIVIAKMDESSKELSIFDCNQIICSDSLEQGRYFELNDFFDESTNVLIEKDSASYFLMENNKILHNEQEVQVKGVYQPTSILASSYGQYEVVTTLYHASDLEGTYYFDQITRQLLDQLINIFKENDYECEYINDGFNEMSYLEVFISQSEYLPMLLSIIFIYFSLAVTVGLIFQKYTRLFVIHWTCGASKVKLFVHVMRKIVSVLFVSILLGNFIGCLLLRHIIEVNLGVVLISFFIQFFSIMVMLVAVYLKQKIEKE